MDETRFEPIDPACRAEMMDQDSERFDPIERSDDRIESNSESLRDQD